ncbi:MAG: ABC transporter substrate-binding protein [Ilumatobacter sp.]|nr:ABC transporter substrate-binding protein [Ilumatobacter sp.]
MASLIRITVRSSAAMPSDVSPRLLLCNPMVRFRRFHVRRHSLAVLAIAAAACTPGSDAAPETTQAASTTTFPALDQSDGILTIGLLLPSSNPTLGQGLIDAANIAVDRINDARGVLGRNVRVVEQDEGLGDGTAAASIAALLESTPSVDAVIGPSSSLVALSQLDTLVAAGIPSCSPTATALALDEFPDERLFFRTVPSDSLQAVAAADLAERTGVQDVAVVYIDDAYGRPFAAAVEDALAAGTRSVSRVETYGFVRTDGDLADKAQRVADSRARVAILLAGSDDGAAFLEALDDTSFGSITDIIVNDALRDPSITPRVEALDPALRALVRGVAPQAQSSDADRPFDPPGLFAAQAFDCVNLIALAAYSVDSDDPAEFASQIPALTVGGRVCLSFEACSVLLDEPLDINYNGPDGITELLVIGDPARARFDVFRFDDTGRAEFIQSLVAEVR